MGQFSQPSAAPGIRSPRNLPLSPVESNVQNTAVSSDNNVSGLSMLSPYGPGTSWASMVNTPMMGNFPNQQAGTNDLVANETAMRLQALSTFNNRFQLDTDVRKYSRRARSTEGEKIGAGQQVPPALQSPGLMRNELGQILTPQQAAALQAQQLAVMNGGRSRPNSPARADMGQGMPNMNVPPQNNGFLSVYNGNAGLLNNGMANLSLGQYNVGSEGYLSDGADINRGRSPRGRRGTSKPPEDPTDVELLKDIPAWLRSLRLHKYTDNLKDIDWKDLIQLDDAGLEKRGVNALGARRKMLKVSSKRLGSQCKSFCC